KLESMAKPRRPSQLNYSHNVNTNIAYFDLVSETHLSTFDQLVEDKFIQGIVIGAFGAGNVPSMMIPYIYKAVYEKGKAIAVITNNKKGSSDMGLYDVGAAAVKAGAISLGPMTKPAAIEKMRYAVNNAQGDDKIEYLQDVARLLLTSVAEEVPESFSRHAVNQFRDRFRKTALPLDSFYNYQKPSVSEYEVKKYCKSTTSPHKILVISVGGTFYMEANPENALTPTKRPLGDLFSLKFKNLDRLVSLDYIELFNLDSTDIEHFHRAELAKVIAKYLSEYDGFVVLHGTDTLAYTASAISYMLLGIDKDVILTGAQKPGYGSSDFDRNFIKSIKVILARLAQPKQSRVSPGVKVAFGDKLMIGTTVIKEDEHGINAFAPIEKHQLAGKINATMDLYDVNKNVKKRDFSLVHKFSQEVAYFECINGIEAKQFENIIENPRVKAVLIGGYDGGNMPLYMKYYIATAVNSYHKPVAFISHSDNGVAEITAIGRIGEFVKAGAIALGDMIKESAYQKLCFAVGLADNYKGIDVKEKVELVRKIMHTNLAGEISDHFCAQGDVVYKGLFCERTFSDEEVQKLIIQESQKEEQPQAAVKEVPKDLPKENKSEMVKEIVKEVLENKQKTAPISTQPIVNKTPAPENQPNLTLIPSKTK
ncbi:MAG: asparaginase domain-containing protein, partial [Candidatus Paceibacterota bacterium]